MNNKELEALSEKVAIEFLSLVDPSSLFYSRFFVEDEEMLAEVVFNDRFGITRAMLVEMTPILKEYMQYLVAENVHMVADNAVQDVISVRDIVVHHILAVMDMETSSELPEGVSNFKEMTETVLKAFDGQLAVDLDGTLCEPADPENPLDYANAVPIEEAIKVVRYWAMKDIPIAIHTSRPLQDLEVTQRWLDKHKVPSKIVSMGKLKAAIYIDDKSFNPKVVPIQDIKKMVAIEK